jgi:phosphoesterase RecJ-like protein
MAIESMAGELFDEVLAELKGARRVLVGTHLNPDGDALGSALAMAYLLDELGVECEVVCNNPAPWSLEFLPGVHRLRQAPLLRDHDLGVVLDLDALDRLGRTRPYFEALPRLIVVDHHIPHESPGHVRLIDATAPATALILTRLVRHSGVRINASMATCLLAGIVTDTGSFRFSNTTPEALSLSAELLACGGDIATISEEVYQKKPLPAVRLLGRLLAKMRIECDARLATASLDVEDFLETEAGEEHTEGLVNELLAIRTVRIAAVIREPKPGKVRASLRSRGEVDVAEVARRFGGGGHRNAAGCTFDEPLEMAERRLVEALKTCLESS